MRIVQSGTAQTSPQTHLQTDRYLQGRMLLLVRALWLLLTVGMLATLIPSIPAYYLLQHRVCDNPGNCLVFGQATPGKLLALQQLGLSLDNFALYTVCLQIVVTLVFLTMGALIFWRKSNSWLGLSVSFFLILMGCSGAFESLTVASGTTDLPLVLRMLISQFYGVADPALGIFMLIFPTGRFTPRWTWVVGVLWATNMVTFGLPAPYTFFYWPPVLQASDILLEIVSVIAIQVYRYRQVYTPTERQQTKWLFFGFASGALCFLFFFFGLPIVPGLNAPDSPLQLLDSVGGALLYSSIPVGVGIAIMRYRLWDIDRVINRTLVYGLLTLILVLVYAGLVFGAQALLVGFVGNNNGIVIVGSTLIVAVLFQPLRRGIQNVIDRRFYRRKYDAQRTLQVFSETLQQEIDLAQLSEQIVAVAQETVQPAYVSLWLVKPGGKERMLQHGSPEEVRG